LRTPLNAIGGHTQLLSMGLHGALTDAQRDTLVRIDRAQRHLLGLINDVLNLAKLEAASVAFDIASLRVGELIETVIAMIEPQLQEKGLTYEVRVDDPELAVLADQDKLVQILLNLLANAVKFTPARSPRGTPGCITLGVAVRQGAPDVVDLDVCDTGIGIAADKLESIFEPFVQVASSWSERNSGTGLGLAISRDLARGMGGDISVRSVLGEGACFTLSLRRAGSGATGQD
jgi:signal transduction histidine kinase